jgi:hypothetical protein
MLPWAIFERSSRANRSERISATPMRAVLRVADRRIAHGIGQATGFDLQMIALDRQRVRMDWRGGENV